MAILATDICIYKRCTSPGPCHFNERNLIFGSYGYLTEVLCSAILVIYSSLEHLINITSPQSQSTSACSTVIPPQLGRARDNHQYMKVSAPYILEYIVLVGLIVPHLMR